LLDVQFEQRPVRLVEQDFARSMRSMAAPASRMQSRRGAGDGVPAGSDRLGQEPEQSGGTHVGAAKAALFLARRANRRSVRGGWMPVERM